jgi:hypothetical protein
LASDNIITAFSRVGFSKLLALQASKGYHDIGNPEINVQRISFLISTNTVFILLVLVPYTFNKNGDHEIVHII